MTTYDLECPHEILATQTGRCTVARIADAQGSVIVKRVSGFGRREAPVLNYVSQFSSVPIPHIIECRDTEDFTELVLTDVGRLSVHELNSVDHVVNCAASIGGFHSKTQFEMLPPVLADLPITYSLEDEFDSLIDRMYYTSVDLRLCKRASSAVRTSLDVLSSECPTCVIHGDPHLANWVAASPESDKVTLIDWAQARIGYGYVDLVRLLTVPAIRDRFTFDEPSRLAAIESYCDASGLLFPSNRCYRSAAALAITNSLNWQHIDAIRHHALRTSTAADGRTRKLTAMLQAVVTLVDFDN